MNYRGAEAVDFDRRLWPDDDEIHPKSETSTFTVTVSGTKRNRNRNSRRLNTSEESYCSGK
jgi:hypothetical protein